MRRPRPGDRPARHSRAAERHTILRDWNDTAHPVPAATLPQLFEAQVARIPDAIAVVYEDASLSYGELDARANQLAHHLRAHGVGPEVVVGLCVERSLDMVVGLIGILKAGGAYLPLDPDYPPDRLAFMLADAGAPLLVTQAAAARAHPGAPRGRHLARRRLARHRPPPVNAPATRLSPQHPAYVIYTSGSTGLPKGVAVAHRGLHNYSYSFAARTIDRTSVQERRCSRPSRSTPVSRVYSCPCCPESSCCFFLMTNSYRLW